MPRKLEPGNGQNYEKEGAALQSIRSRSHHLDAVCMPRRRMETLSSIMDADDALCFLQLSLNAEVDAKLPPGKTRFGRRWHGAG